MKMSDSSTVSTIIVISETVNLLNPDAESESSSLDESLPLMHMLCGTDPGVDSSSVHP